jgi:hypothetical protein
MEPTASTFRIENRGNRFFGNVDMYQQKYKESHCIFIDLDIWLLTAYSIDAESFSRKQYCSIHSDRPIFRGIISFIYVFRRVLQWTAFWARWTESKPTFPISLWLSELYGGTTQKTVLLSPGEFTYIVQPKVPEKWTKNCRIFFLDYGPTKLKKDHTFFITRVNFLI